MARRVCQRCTRFRWLRLFVKRIGLLKKGQRQKTYQKLVEITCGIWKKGEGLAYQGKDAHRMGIDFCLTHLAMDFYME